MITLDKDNIERTTRGSDGQFVSCDAHWTPYVIDPFTRDCECTGPVCDSRRDWVGSCPRFYDECGECHSRFGDSGWLCLDGGDIACEACVTFRIDFDGNRF